MTLACIFGQDGLSLSFRFAMLHRVQNAFENLPLDHMLRDRAFQIRIKGGKLGFPALLKLHKLFFPEAILLRPPCRIAIPQFFRVSSGQWHGAF